MTIDLGRSDLVNDLHLSLAEKKTMNILEVEEQIPVGSAGISKNSDLSITCLPIVATSYVVVSLYFIFEARVAV